MKHTIAGGCTALSGDRRSRGGFEIGRTLVATSAAFLSFLAATLAGAADLSVGVTDRGGHGVQQVVVTVTPLADALPAHPPRSAVMDQQNLEFLPRVLVVGVGARVEFPNNDLVSHQVYSFSEAKRFQLPLYKGRVHPPLTFDRPGLVVLGCNIHDSMVGYVYVTDAPYFAATDSGGALELNDLPPGDYRVVLWSPFIADPPPSLTRTVHLEGSKAAVLSVHLTAPLRAQPQPRPRHPDWEY